MFATKHYFTYAFSAILLAFISESDFRAGLRVPSLTFSLGTTAGATTAIVVAAPLPFRFGTGGFASSRQGAGLTRLRQRAGFNGLRRGRSGRVVDVFLENYQEN